MINFSEDCKQTGWDPNPVRPCTSLQYYCYTIQ